MKARESDRPDDENGIDLLGVALELLGASEEAPKSDPTPQVVEPAEMGDEAQVSSPEIPPAATPIDASAIAFATVEPALLGPDPLVAPSRPRLEAAAPAPRSRAGVAAPSASQSLLARLRAATARSAGLQFALLAAAGTGVLGAWTFFDRPPPLAPESRAAQADASPAPQFPKLDVAGVDRVREEDVQALFEPKPPAKAEPAPPPAERPEPAEHGVVVLKPGQLADEHGNVTDLSGHRTVATRAVVAPRGPSAEPAVSMARFFVPGGLLTGAAPPRNTGESVLPLRVGERVRVKLEVGVVSSMREDVLASVLEDVIRDGRRILAKGDMLRGSASHDDKRMFLRFRSAEVGGRSLELSAYAVDGAMPGLVARRREATIEERTRAHATSNVIGGVAAEAGAALSGAAAVGRIAERVANGAAAEASSAVEPDRTWVLEVSAGRTFEIVVTEAKKS